MWYRIPAVDCLLGTSFIDHHVKTILLLLRKRCVLPLRLRCHHRSALPHQAENIPHTCISRPISKNSDNAEIHRSFNVPGKHASTVSDRAALLYLENMKTRHQTSHYDSKRDYRDTPTENLSCFPVQFLLASSLSFKSHRHQTRP